MTRQSIRMKETKCVGCVSPTYMRDLESRYARSKIHCHLIVEEEVNRVRQTYFWHANRNRCDLRFKSMINAKMEF